MMHTLLRAAITGSLTSMRQSRSPTFARYRASELAFALRAHRWLSRRHTYATLMATPPETLLNDYTQTTGDTHH